MRNITLELQFFDKDYEELEGSAKRLECSVEEVLVKFLQEGFADWAWVEEELYERKQIEKLRKKLIS